jgi:putative ABC transport system permease protein
MRVLTLAWRNLRRRPFRSALTVVGVTVAVASVVALVGIAESLEGSFLALYQQRGTDLVVQRRGGTVQLSKGVPLALEDRIRALPGAGQVIGSLMDMVAFEKQGLFMVIVNGWKFDCPVLRRVKMIEGRSLQSGDQKCVLLGCVLAASLRKRSGDSIEIYGRPFTVIGVFESFSIYENGAVWMPLDELQKQMDRPGQVTGYVVQADPAGDPGTISSLKRSIEGLDPAIAATPCAEFVSSLTQMRVTRSMAWLVSAIAGVIGAFGVLNTMSMTVFERRCEIGALRSMGWRKGRIVRLILLEALLLAAAGAILGIVVGVLSIFCLSHWHVTAVIIDGGIPLRTIGEAVLLAIGMASLGSAYTAWSVARIPPAMALRGT